MKIDNLSIKKYSIWIFFVFCFAIAPGILLIYGIEHLKSISHTNALNKYTQNVSQFYEGLKPYVYGEEFWCNFLSDQLNPIIQNANVSKKQILSVLKKTRKHVAVPYILFNFVTNYISNKSSIKNNKTLFLAISLLAKKLRNKNMKYTKAETLAICRVFGPQLVFKQLDDAYNNKIKRLAWTDSSGKKPLLYARIVGKYLLIFFIDQKLLPTSIGVRVKMKEFSSRTSQHYQFILMENKNIYSLNPAKLNVTNSLVEKIKQAMNKKMNILETDDYILYPRFLTPKLSACTIVTKKNISTFNINNHYLIISLYILLALFISWHLHGLIISYKPDLLPIRWKLRFLFIFANALPLLVLFYLGSIFLSQERGNLLAKKLQTGTEFLQSFDKKLETKYAKATLQHNKGLEDFIESVKSKELSQDIVSKFLKRIGDIRGLYMVASKSKALITSKGLIDVDRGIFPKTMKKEKITKKLKTKADFIKRIGKFFLNMLNKTKISSKDATEMELLIESFSQKPLTNFMHQFLSMRDSMVKFGFGDTHHPAILSTLYFGNPKSFQYFVIRNWDTYDFQWSFLENNISKANRNNLGIEVITHWNENKKERVLPPDTKLTKSLKNFINMLSTYPSDKVELVEYKDQKYLAMGFKGNWLSMFKLIGLYPVSDIDDRLALQKRNLMLFALISLLITFTLSQLLTQSLLVPLNHLALGAKAIENQTFSHRLPNLGLDEFGRMGKIFNDVMPDLEELSVAGIIQEELLPQTGIPTGKFSLFGKSISMSQLGGDYFDYMTVSEDSFGVLLGDVAGHGVGASLIMAMAKAGIVLADDLLSKPQELSLKLHNLIHASRTKKQRKIMTFQYLHINKNTGKGTYSNAGACSPILVNPHKKTAEEITLAGPALGAFKRAKYSQIELCLEPDEAIIFYTDGIVETRNADDEEIGYENMKKMYLDCWSRDAEEYYNRIITCYHNHLGDEGAQDDLTIVVLVNAEKSKQNT